MFLGWYAVLSEVAAELATRKRTREQQVFDRIVPVPRVRPCMFVSNPHRRGCLWQLKPPDHRARNDLDRRFPQTTAPLHALGPMPKYSGSPHFTHGLPERIGILLVNLGTPDAPSPGAVRKFLAEFLGDPRVVEAPRWLWLAVLHGVILRIRPRRSAHAYRLVWTPQGSPLMVFTRELADRLQRALLDRLGPMTVLAMGMTYGNPSIATALQQLRDQNANRIVVLPLYPQYSGTTTASVFDRVTSTLRRWRWVPELRFIMQYHDEPAYLDAVAASIERQWRDRGQRHLLFSFHGIPKSYLLAGDPYHCQCLKTARRVSERLKLADGEWSVSFQSQVGRAEWLRPYTDELLIKYAREGPREITVACPGFAIDCLETLEEIELRNRETFLANGGTAYDYVPALNSSDAQVALLADLVARHTQGWPKPSAASDIASAERAKLAGAAR
jgi:ferrochelatase